MFEWWADLSWVAKLGLAGVFLAISSILWAVGLFWPSGWAAGGILLLLSIPWGRGKKDHYDW